MYHISRCYLCFLLTLITYFTLAQDTIPKSNGDLHYREDQFCIGISYNLLSSIPMGVNPEGLSGGFYFGFLRDMPINKNRNIAIALGLGLSFDRYSHNLFIDKDIDGNTTYTILNSTENIDSNLFKTSIVEFPLEFRWRSSTPTSYKFWRVYVALKFGYAISYQATLKDISGSISHSDISEFNRLSLGTTLSLGYNKFNFYLYYSIIPFFNDTAITNDGQQVDFKTIKLGLIFYIL